MAPAGSGRSPVPFPDCPRSLPNETPAPARPADLCCRNAAAAAKSAPTRATSTAARPQPPRNLHPPARRSPLSAPEPSTEPPRIRHYITGHGFGHATRALEVVRHLVTAGHDVHVVIAAPEFVFTTEIASPSLSDKLASPSTSEMLAPAPWMEAQNRLPSRILHHASRPLPARKPPPAHSPPPHPLSGACATASLDQRHAYAITPSLLLPSAVLTFAIAQSIKVLTTWYKENRWDAKQLVGSGGMPSSHSATVTALAVAVGL
eukprot:XP_023156445.1 uncharacterized protein LOC103633730 [Zea mays]